MNSLKKSNWMRWAALAALAVSLGSTLANAQDIEGKFNLPFTALWGGAVLTPGQYSFTYGAVTPSGTQLITVSRGRRHVAMILAGSTSEGQFSDPSHLTAVRVAGTYRITSLQLNEQEIRLDFALPKGEVLEASQTTALAHNVSVLMAAK
jgi:hypothetical protein